MHHAQDAQIGGRARASRRSVTFSGSRPFCQRGSGSWASGLSEVRAQAGDGHGHEPLNRGFGWQAGGRVEGVEAVAGQLLGRDIVADVARLGGLGQQICYEAEQVLLGLGDVLAAMQERRHVVVVMLVLDERIGLEDGTEPLTGVAGLVPDVLKMLKVTGDLALVPGQQDRFDVGKPAPAPG